MTIDELAAVARAGLDADHEAVDALLGACRIPGKQPDFFGAGGPAAEALWQRYGEERVLAEVRAKRQLVAALLREKHGRDCVSSIDGWCDCGRDARVHAYLTLLAQPYQETT